MSFYKNLKKWVLILLVIVTALTIYFKKVKAETHDDVITEIEVLLEDGTDPVTNITQWQVFRVKASFLLPNGKVKPGDTTTIKLPDKLKFDQKDSLQIKDENGNVVANAVIDGANKTITLTYTDFVESNSDVEGNFFFYVRLDRDKVEQEEDIPLVFEVGANTIVGPTIHFVGYPNPSPYEINKVGRQTGGSNPRELTFDININTAGVNLNKAILTDEVVDPGFTILKDTLLITKGKWVIVKGDWELQDRINVTPDYEVVWNADNTSFSIDFDHIKSDEGFNIRYNVLSSEDLNNGESVKNIAKLSGVNFNEKVAVCIVTFKVAGGSAEGSVYTIKIYKQNKNNEPLSGAVFNVIRVSDNKLIGQYTTDATGEITVTGLLKDSYRIVEVAPPNGYILSGETVTVTNSDFNHNKVAPVNITNELATKSIKVSKEWVWGMEESVTVRLVIINTAGTITNTGRSVVLNNDNYWSASFDDLAVYDEDGNEINYYVEEDEISGYKTEVSKDNEGNFVIVNTKDERIDIPVKKEWVGPGLESVIVDLLADNTIIKRAELNKDNDWTYVFKDLPVRDKQDGHKISYYVDEKAEGYSTEIKGDANTSFVIKNTNIETVNIPVKKVWVGEEKSGVVVRLYADDKEIRSVVINKNSNWQFIFVGLPVYSSDDGHEIKYRISEDKVSGYSINISGSIEDGFIIKNIKNPNKHKSPKTGID